MSSDRQDYLGTACDLGGLTLPEFQEAFCSRCSQPECSRSLFGKTRFDQRVQNWHERLFAKVPQMTAEDPRFAVIAGQKFLSIEASRPGASSEWLDPKDVQEKASAIIVPAAVPPSPPSPPSPPPAPRPTPRSLPVMNTPFQNGTMIGSAPAPQPAADPWAAPSKPKEAVIKPGTKVKLGGGGV